MDRPVAQLLAVTALLAATLSSMATPAAAQGDHHLVLKLTLAGPIPGDAAFNMYVQTDPPTLGQSLFTVCARTEFTRPCEARTYTAKNGPFMAGTVIVFRYLRWNGVRQEAFYAGRVTLPEQGPDPVYHVTYDYGLDLPDTSVTVTSPEITTADATPFWFAALTLAVVAVLLVSRRRAPRSAEELEPLPAKVSVKGERRPDAHLPHQVEAREIDE
jgi:hypothetical protein